jgi:arsenate reductase-like glutaredoxin family protein
MDSQSVKVEATKEATNPKANTVYKAGGESPAMPNGQADKKEDAIDPQAVALKLSGEQVNNHGSSQLNPETSAAGGIKLSMIVDPHDSPDRPENSVYKNTHKTLPGKYLDDVDEGVGISPVNLWKAAPKASHREQEQVVEVEPVQMPQIEDEEENSLIHDGDSLVRQMDDPNSKGQKPSTAMTVINGGPPRAPKKKKSHKTTFDAIGYEVKGNTKLMAPAQNDENASQHKPNGEPANQQTHSPSDLKQEDIPGQAESQSYVPAASQYMVQHHNKNPLQPANDSGKPAEKKEEAQQDARSVVISEMKPQSGNPKGENPAPIATKSPDNIKPTTLPDTPVQQAHAHPMAVTPESPPRPSSPLPSPQAPHLTEMMEVHSEDLNGSNVANLDDSLKEENNRPSNTNPMQNSETQSKFQNNFDKYMKDEAGMSVFAPADIDYSDRANRAEAHLMKYESDIRARYEKVARGMQQIYSNIQKINIGAHESAARFRTFFQGLMQKTERVAAMYSLPDSLNVMIDRKDMQDLRPAGNLHDLQKTFETMKLQRAEHSSQLLRELREMKQEYQNKIVEENFFEEGIDQKTTVEMQKGIEKGFESIYKRNKQCIDQYGVINKKIEENKMHFEKKKKFKTDTFEDYMNYLRDVRKLWMFIMDNQEKLVKYWERVRTMEELRIKAITHILQRYFLIEEKLSSVSHNTEALKKMNSQISPEGMAAAIYSDRSFLNSPLLESIGIKLESVKVFTNEIKKLKNNVPEIVEFALWDYTNLNTLVKSVNTPLRIFRSNENTLYIYHQVKDRSEVPMEPPLFKCKVNSLLLQFDERNNCITLKGSGFFNFSNFTFNLREHQDAKDFESIVNKFCKNSKESS